MQYLNVLINSGYLQSTDRELLFPEDEDVIVVDKADIYELLVQLGAFTSKSQARKNWKGGPIKPGWNEWFGIGKHRRDLCIWNPYKYVEVVNAKHKD